MSAAEPKPARKPRAGRSKPQEEDEPLPKPESKPEPKPEPKATPKADPKPAKPRAPRLPRDLAAQAKELKLSAAGLDSAQEFSLDGLTAMGKCTHVYDGDTAHFVIKFNGAWTMFKCRMYGYNTAEMRGGSAETKAQAAKEKDYLAGLILGKIVIVRFGKFDKYGRPLVNITLPDTMLDVNKEMVGSGHAREYYGSGKKI